MLRIWTWFWHNVYGSFKVKFIISLSCIIMLAFGIAGYLTYHSNQQLFRDEMSVQVSITNREALAKLELKVQDMKRLSQTIVFNTEIEEMIERYDVYKNSDAYQLYVEKQRIDELINQLKIDAPYITGLYMFDLSGDTVYYRYNTPSINSLDEPLLKVIRSGIKDSYGELVWMSMALPSSIEVNGTRNTIVAARWMKNDQLQTYGVMVITIDESFLSSSLKELTKDGAGKVYLFNRMNELLYTNAPVETDAGLEQIRELRETQIIDDHLFVQSESSRTNSDAFLLVSGKSMQQIQEKNRNLSEKIIFTGLFSACIAGLLVVLATERLLRPLGDLLKGLQRLRSGKFETRVAVRSRDELAYIGESFNAMAGQLEQLIKEVYLTQLSEREAELKALQAQLNPHFLYNFFNEVYWKLHMRGERDTAELIAAVSGMLRYSLMPVHFPATVREEIGQIQNYLKIQAELFETDLEIDIDIEESVMDCEVMRALLQPIIENVFIHAFRNQVTHKVLRIQLWASADFLHIEITDNGCGMSKAIIDKLLHGKSIAPSEHMDGRESLGVRSVVRRIELLYGAPYRLEMDSVPDQGTTMRLYLPMNRAEKGA